MACNVYQCPAPGLEGLPQGPETPLVGGLLEIFDPSVQLGAVVAGEREDCLWADAGAVGCPEIMVLIPMRAGLDANVKQHVLNQHHVGAVVGRTFSYCSIHIIERRHRDRHD
jgi:hypothetical protein